MGLDAFERLRSNAKGIPDAATQVLDLSPTARDDQWETLQNVRLQYDGPYVFWKKRGGSTLKHTFTANIITLKAFSVPVDGSRADYLVAHCSDGKAYLIEYGDAGSPTEIFGAIFTTTSQIHIVAIGRLVYLFDTTNGEYKVYDVELDQGYDWLSSISGSISSYSWVNGSFRDDNIFGFQEDGEIIVYHNFEDGFYFDSAESRFTYQSFIAESERVFSASLLYRDPAGVEWRSDDDAGIAFLPSTPDLQDYVNKTGQYRYERGKAIGSFTVDEPSTTSTERFFLKVNGIRVPSTGTLEAASSDSRDDVATTMKNALDNVSDITDQWEVFQEGYTVFLRALFPDPSFGQAEFEANITTTNADLQVSSVDPVIPQTAIENPTYVEPILYRGYIVADLLSDGSVRLPGRPTTVTTTASDIAANTRVGVDLSIAAPSDEVFKRYVFATRWQVTEGNVYSPSRPEYDNSAFFLAKEITPNQTSFEDRTPDRELTTPMGNIIPLTGGVYQSFGNGQIEPKSVATVESAMILGGYKINRPVPVHYTDANNPAGANVFTDFGTGTALTNNPELAVLFEYTDGRKSSIVDTGQVLNDAETVIQADVAAVAPYGQFIINNGAGGTGGDISFTYPQGAGGVTATYTYGSTETAIEIGEGLIAAINAEAGMDVSATGGQIVTVTHDDTGPANNDTQGVVSPIDALDVTTDFGDGIVVLEGGTAAVEGITVPRNYVQVHSVNGLVDKVYLLVKVSGSYFLFKECLASTCGFIGQRTRVPNSDSEVSALEAFTAPSAGDIRTSVDLFDRVVTAVPPQNPLIAEQAPIQGGSPIQSIVATQFDTDKSQMRFRLVVFTDRNMQVGYLTSTAEGSAKDFEIAGQGIRLQHPFGAHYVEGNVVFQTEDGIFIFNQQRFDRVLDSRLFAAAQNNLEDVGFNGLFGEYWLAFGDETVISINSSGDRLHEFVYPSPVQSVLSVADDLVVGYLAKALSTDEQATDDDESTAFNGVLITRHLTPSTNQIRILEVDVAGQTLTCTVAIDLQRTRLENSGSAWSKDFTSGVSVGPETLKMYGTPFIFTNRAVMPKVRLTLTGGPAGFVSEVKMRHIVTENKGKAR